MSAEQDNPELMEIESMVHSDHKSAFRSLAIGCIGVVYGDIGTNPLFAFREAVLRASENGHALEVSDIFGLASLILWSLTVVVTLKYILFLLYVDNRGEGGLLSLTTLAQKKMSSSATGLLIFIGLLGAAMFYGDAVVTPAISVLAAVEGIKLIAPQTEMLVLPLTVAILVGLFAFQKRGTADVSKWFGPVMTVWMIVIGLAGLPYIIAHPSILASINPVYAIRFFIAHGLGALLPLGAVFLTIAGAEALYEDLGHFGRRPIQAAWLFLIFPCLALNYLGQAAMIAENPQAVMAADFNPFFQLVPHGFLPPLVILAALATIIASQAVITGAYSLTRSAIQLGLLPRMEVRHTSADKAGQIYMPRVNQLLMIVVLLLVVIFRSSGALASAYGISVSGTFLVTSVLMFVVVWKTWGRGLVFAACVTLPFVFIECVFFSANLIKVFDGGIVPLMLASFLTLRMHVWIKGSRYLAVQASRQTVPLTSLIESLEEEPVHRIPGTAIFLTADSHSTPPALIQNLKHNKVMHERNLILTVVTSSSPRVPDEQRAVVERLGPSITGITLNYGYMESPNIPKALAHTSEAHFDLRDATYFLSRRKLVSDARRGLPEWQDRIFIPMARFAADATDFFHLPPGKVVELGVQIVI